MLKATLIGNLGKDATVNNVNGKNVINFSVAHTEKWKGADGTPNEKTTWVDCSYWTEKVGVAPYLLKGQQVYVEGQPEARSFPKNDGSTGVSLSFRVNSIQLLGGAVAQTNTPTPQAAPKPAVVVEPAYPAADPIDDMPF